MNMTIKDVTNLLGVSVYTVLSLCLLYIAWLRMRNGDAACVFSIGTRKESVLFFFYNALGFLGLAVSRSLLVTHNQTISDLVIVATRMFFFLSTVVLVIALIHFAHNKRLYRTS